MAIRARFNFQSAYEQAQTKQLQDKEIGAQAVIDAYLMDENVESAVVYAMGQNADNVMLYESSGYLSLSDDTHAFHAFRENIITTSDGAIKDVKVTPDNEGVLLMLDRKVLQMKAPEAKIWGLGSIFGTKEKTCLYPVSFVDVSANLLVKKLKNAPQVKPE